MDVSTAFIIRHLFIILTLSLPVSAYATEPTKQLTTEIKPADVFVHVTKVQAELELLRFHMGKPKPSNFKNSLTVSNASPYHVYYQALTLFEKSNQFNFEHLRSHEATPIAPNGAIKPADVFKTIDQSLKLIRAVKAQIGIQTKIKTPIYDPQKTPTDVWLVTISANRQLNLLLDRQFTPEDVYKEVSIAISYSAKLLARFPNTTRIPKAESLAIGKRPSDVLNRLLLIHKKIRGIAKRSNLPVLKIKTNAGDTTIVPSDVYDIAALVVSELALMNSMTPNHSLPRPVYDSGRQYPSNVYQRASILERQIDSLDALSQKAPQWLSK